MDKTSQAKQCISVQDSESAIFRKNLPFLEDYLLKKYSRSSAIAAYPQKEINDTNRTIN